MDELYSVREVADHMRVLPETVRRWIKEQTLPASKIGNMYLIKKMDLDHFLRARLNIPEDDAG